MRPNNYNTQNNNGLIVQCQFLDTRCYFEGGFQVYYPENIVPYVYFKLAKANLL